MTSTELGEKKVFATTTIEGGAVYQVQYTTDPLPAGIQTLHFYVDPGNAVKESDKNNNSRSCAITVAAASGSGKPDLIVSKATFTPANPTTAEEIYILIEVKNQGTAPADFPGGTFWNVILPGGGGIGGSKSLCSIAPGETVTGGGRLAAIGRLAPGTYAVRVVADPENKVAEADETNNESSYNLVVADGGPVDLTISDIQAQTLAGSTNTFKVTVTIKNNGTGKAVFLSGSQVMTSTELGEKKVFATTTIEGGAVYQVQYTTDPLPAGPRTLHFYVDPGNVIKESDKSNNSRSIQVQVP